MTLKDYSSAAVRKKCVGCGHKTSFNPKIEYYNHESGWLVENFNVRQWLYVKCLNCHYDNALWKLGVPGAVEESKNEWARRIIVEHRE